MILNLVAFADLRVDDVMVPRADIVALADTVSVRTLLDCFIEANHSGLSSIASRSTKSPAWSMSGI